jgi:hypothetical protein
MKKITNTKTKTSKATKATTQSAGCREHPVPYPGCPNCEAEATRQERMKADQAKLKAGDQKRKASVKAAKATKVEAAATEPRTSPLDAISGTLNNQTEAKPKAAKAAKVVTPANEKATKATKAASVAKEPKAAGSTKKDQVLALISGKNGATLDEIMTATGWQKHTVRGFIAILGKKGTKIESSKSEVGARTYKAA